MIGSSPRLLIEQPPSEDVAAAHAHAAFRARIEVSLSAASRRTSKRTQLPTIGRVCDAAVMWKARRAAREQLEMLMRGRPRFKMHFSKSQTAASLWDYAEDELAERALQMGDADLERVQAIAAHYESRSYPLPVEGQRITHNHVIALAAVTYFEGHLRPLARNRRRPEKDRPERFTPVPVPPDYGLPQE